MQNTYHPIQLEAEHEELLERHRDLIRKAYHIDNEELKILEVEAKLGEHEGVYYRMTIRDGNRKTYRVKLEKPQPQSMPAEEAA